jgi:hypothetical protein
MTPRGALLALFLLGPLALGSSRVGTSTRY